MISHTRRCIFVHIPKTGGTSVENLIWPMPRTANDLWMGFRDNYHNKYQTGGLQHLLATQIRSEVGSEIFSAYYKFSFVRNPWDRAVSQFASMAGREDLRDFIGMKKGDSFKQYLTLTSKRKHVQWEPQVNFLRDPAGELLVDYIGKFERLGESVLHVLSTLGVEAKTIPRTRKRRWGRYSAYYDDESRETIAEIYKLDIETFGYAFA
ncbi:MAG: sulfotransferase family 2 domain-containing protein [Chthoniobacterales bacterium]|nr:sulfotransferase family 2 domain-containing protein [Chthoniobacterales bacterium]MBA3763819.1 sulfotransferase family 2 domain-containing protein [Chthoniobacterales bacterium]